MHDCSKTDDIQEIKQELREFRSEFREFSKSSIQNSNDIAWMKGTTKLIITAIIPIVISIITIFLGGK